MCSFRISALVVAMVSSVVFLLDHRQYPVHTSGAVLVRRLSCNSATTATDSRTNGLTSTACAAAAPSHAAGDGGLVGHRP
jgi:hypothetical protein